MRKPPSAMSTTSEESDVPTSDNNASQDYSHAALLDSLEHVRFLPKDIMLLYQVLQQQPIDNELMSRFGKQFDIAWMAFAAHGLSSDSKHIAPGPSFHQLFWDARAQLEKQELKDWKEEIRHGIFDLVRRLDSVY